MIGLGAYLACQAYFWKGSVGYEGRLYNGGGVDAEVEWCYYSPSYSQYLEDIDNVPAFMDIRDVCHKANNRIASQVLLSST